MGTPFNFWDAQPVVLARLAAVFALAASLTQTALAAPRWDFSDYPTQDPAKLFRLAWDSDSPTEKLRIRSWLAAQHADKPEGLFSRAWLAGADQDKGQEQRLYQECVGRYPKFAPCLINGANVEINAGNAGQGAVASEALLAITPAQLNPDDDVTALRNGFFFLLNTKKDKAAAAAHLARFRAQYPQAWSLDFVEGLSLQDNSPAQAAALFQSAIGKGGRNTDPEVFERLMNLEAGVLYDPAKGSRFDVAARRVLQFYRSTGNWRSNSLVLALLENHVDGETAQGNLVRQFEGLGLKPSMELLNKVPTTVASSHPEWSTKLRRQLGVRAQADPTLNAWLGQMALLADNQPAEATRLYRLAMDGAYSERQRTEMASWLVFRLRTQGDCQAADQEAKALLARHTGLAERAEFFSNWLEAQLCVGDLAGARNSLARRAALGHKASDLVSDEARLALLGAEQAALGQDRGQAFLNSWQAGTNGKLTLQIEFATASAQIPPRFDPQLKQVADALKQPQAGDYVFEVSGHTDNTGDAALNLALSQRRAQAVVDHLIQRHGLSSLRLRANGFGPGHPVADNLSDAGRQRNRRVEITPVSSAAAPTIARAGKPAGTPTLSPDGRLLFDSEGVLWDTRQWIALRRLPDFRLAEFSRDGRYVIGLTNPEVTTLDTSVWVYSLATNKVVARRLLGPKAATERFALAPDGQRLALVRDGLLEVLALPGLRRLAEVQLSRLSASGVVAWIGNDRLAAAVRYGGEVLQVLNASTLKVERSFDDVDYVHTLGASPSGRYLVATPNDGRLLVWDTATWQRREIARGQWSRYSTTYRFHPLREQLVADQWNGSRGHTTVLVDLDTLQVSKPIAEGAGQRAAYAPDGESIYVAGYPVKRLNLRTLEPMPLAFAEQAGFSRWTFYGAEGLITTPANEQRLVWDVATARPQHRLKNLGTPVYGQPDQRWTSDDAGQVQAIDTRNFQLSPLGKKPDGYDGWYGQLTARHWVMTRRIEVKVGSETRAKEAELAIVERNSGKVVGRHRFALPTEDFIHSSDEYPLQSGYDTALSSDGRHLAIRTDWKEHWGYPTRSSKIVQIFDLQTGQRAKRLELNKPVTGLEFRSEQAGILLVRTETYINRYELAADRYGTGYPVARSDRLVFDDGQRRILRNGYYITHVRTDGSTQVLPVAGATDGMALPANNLLLLEFGDELRYYDLKTLSHQLSVLARANGEWIAYTPDGQYSASPQGTAGLYWSLGEATLPFSALKEKFERPNTVRERLQGLLQGQAAVVAPIQLVDSGQANARPTSPQQPAAAAAAQLDTSFFDPPFKLRVIDAPKTVDAPALTLKVGITKTRATDVEPAVELNVNGQQIEARGLARLEAGAGTACMEGAAGTTLKVGCETVRSLPLSLEEGRNVVVVNAFFKGGRAQPEVVAIERRKAAATGPLPRLWFFGVGVSQYSDPRNNLQFAHRDAEALAAAFAKQEGKLYAKVNTKLLLNKDADARTVKAEMNRFLRQASSQDLIVIFLAGHGLQDNDQTLYFMTADSNLAEPFTGIGVSELQDFLRRRPMSQKALLLLDICHAGAAAGQLGRRGVPSGDDVINQLANGTGVKVLASSQGREYSLEQPNFRGGHGAFTAALLEGLEGKARSGSGPAVSVLDLERYVSRRVPELTQGKQHPTAPDSNNFQDYPLAVQ